MTTRSPDNWARQVLIEEFFSQADKTAGRRSSKGACARTASRLLAAARPSAPLPEPPFSQLEGQPVLKDFLEEGGTGVIRPFQGKVVRYNPKNQCYQVDYEDGDWEELEWEQLYPIMQRARAAGLASGAAGSSEAAMPKSGKRQQAVAAAAAAPVAAGAKKREQPPKQQQQQQQRRRQQQQRQQQQQQTNQRAAKLSSAGQPGKKRKAGGSEQAPGVGSSDGQPGTAKKAKKEKAAGAASGRSVAAAAAGAEQAEEGGRGGGAPRQAQQGQQPAERQRARLLKKEKPPPMELPVPKINKEYRYERGQEPWRTAPGFCWQVQDELDLSAEKVNRIRAAQRMFNQVFIKAEVDEQARVDAEVADQQARGVFLKEPRPCRRADRKTESRIKKAMEALCKQKKAAAAEEKKKGGGGAGAAGAASAGSGGGAAAAAAAEGRQRGEDKESAEDREAIQRLLAPDNRRVLEGFESLRHGKRKVLGHYDGWDIGSRAYSRAELSCIGFHYPPIAGIDYIARGVVGNGAPPVASSVMVSGWYQDDQDTGDMLWYTGEGGNDLLHGRNQIEDQKMARGNAALLGNIQLGIPVRVTRKQSDPKGHFGCAYIYDGLYDVEAYRYQPGKEGKRVYQFKLVRRSGQGPLLSQRVDWGTVAAPKQVLPATRQGVVDLDISRGQEEHPIAAIDATWLAHGSDHKPHGELPPCTGLGHVVEEKDLVGKALRGINQAKIEELRREGYKPSVEYIMRYELVDEAVQAAAKLKAAKLPPKYAADPHGYLRELNHGGLPYNDKGQLFHMRPVVYECGPWANCKLGKGCPQAVSQRPCRFRMELFWTGRERGWGVRCLDLIPMHAFIILYLGEVYLADHHQQLVDDMEDQDPGSEYTFDLVPRPDTNWDGSEKAVDEASDACAHFVCCGLRKRNIAAFINHSCAPNCFVQPVLTEHHDERMPALAIFAADNIAPMTELTLHYGEAYVAKFDGGCRCGAPDCISTQGSGEEAASGSARKLRTARRTPAKGTPARLAA